jgi:hypothetical protein
VLIAPLLLLVVLIAAAPALRWVREHPQHNPWARLTLDQPVGWATRRKLAAMGEDQAACHGLLRSADVAFTPLPAVGSGQCLATSRTRIEPGRAAGFRLMPTSVAPSCVVDAGLLIWMRHVVQPAAQRHFGQRVTLVENLGSYNCRRIGGGDSGSWSEHASGNAIDISAFVLADGRRIVLTRDWQGDTPKAAFLHDARDGACGLFSTVLSPDYNRAHANHFHFDQARRVAGWGVCR